MWATLKPLYPEATDMSGSTLERSEDNGQFTSDTDEKILAAMPPNEPVRARDIADETDIPRTTVNYNLNKLADAGEVEKKKFHERRVVWWRSE